MATESIHDFVESKRDGGYGVALIAPDGEILAPYVDPDDYPDMEVNTTMTGPNGHGTGEYDGYLLVLHGGAIEEMYRAKENYYD